MLQRRKVVGSVMQNWDNTTLVVSGSVMQNWDNTTLVVSGKSRLIKEVASHAPSFVGVIDSTRLVAIGELGRTCGHAQAG
jgi:hypothetical protein